MIAILMIVHVINCKVHFSLFATSFYVGYLFWYLYLYFYVAVIIKFNTVKKKYLLCSGI